MKKLLLPLFLSLAFIGCDSALDLSGAKVGDEEKTVTVTVSNVPDDVIGEELYLFTRVDEELYAGFQTTAVEGDTIIMIAPPKGTKPYEVIAYIPTDNDWLPGHGLVVGWYSAIGDVKDREANVLISTWNELDEHDIDQGGGEHPIEVELTVPDGSHDGDYKAGDIVNISAVVTNNQAVDVTIATVEFFINGTLTETLDVAPYEFQYNTVGLVAGIYEVEVVATNSLEQTESEDEQFTIILEENEAPCVEITSPSNNAKIVHGTTSYTISAKAGDDDEVIKVEFIFDGQVVETLEGDDLTTTSSEEAAGCSGTTYSYTWNTFESSVGASVVEVRATDSDNVVRTDVINIEFTQPDNYTPYIEVTSPVEDAEFNVGQTLNISTLNYDLDSEIDSVEFYVGGVYAGVDKASGYSGSHILGFAGNQNVQARAYYADENDNAISVTDNVSIVVNAVAP
ncbi:MAG: Ig-like domain-containing protein [Reichenbachiella sp.]